MLSPSDFNNAVPQFTNGNYASNPINPQYIAEPDAESYNRGTEPLQTLPAQWWNWFINKFTARFNKVNIYVKNIFNELAQILSIFNITPDGTEQTPTTSQLKTVFETCYPQYVKTVTTGTAVGCIPTVGTALGTTNNNILVTDSTGKLKPSGITVGTAAGCDATFFAKKTEVDALYGNVVGTALGTAAVGTCTTFARSDHVHPVTGLATTCLDGITSCLKLGYAGIYSGFMETTDCGFVPACIDATNGYGYLGVYGWPFKEVHAKNFYGSLQGNAYTSTYAFQATGPIPFDAAEESHPLGTCVRAVVTKGTTEGIGYRSRMAIGLMYCGAWAHGLISVGCNDAGTEWDNFIFPVGHGGNVVTSSTIGYYTAGHATSADTVDGYHVYCCSCSYNLLRAVRGVDVGSCGNGYYAGMTNANLDGASKWWHIISTDWMDYDPTHWISQLFLPTENGGVPKYRHNDAAGTDISLSTIHSFITDENIGSQCVAGATNAWHAIRAGALEMRALTQCDDCGTYYYHAAGCTFLYASTPLMYWCSTEEFALPAVISVRGRHLICNSEIALNWYYVDL